MAYEFYRHGIPNPTLELNPQVPSSHMTIPIVGVPRGGTTMVAAVVDALGVDLGPAKELAKFTYEDQTMTKSDPAVTFAYIAQRNREREVWGWKYPTAVERLQSLFFSLRNPRMIMVFRDMIASMDSEMRFDENNNINPRRTFSTIAQSTLNWWTNNMEFIRRTHFPVLLVSYERALKSPDRFIRDVGVFLDINPTHEQFQEALARINPQGGYLKTDEQCHPVRIVEPLPEITPEGKPRPPEPPGTDDRQEAAR